MFQGISLLQNHMIKNQNQKLFHIIHYGNQIHLFHLKKSKQLWGRAFIDPNIYLEDQISNESLFTIQPKKGLQGFHTLEEHNDSLPVLFGAQVLIRHCLSGFYIAINEKYGIPTLQFTKQQSSACYFEFVSLRSFETKGNPVTSDSLFKIQHSKRKMFISCSTDSQNNYQNEEMMSPRLSIRKTRDKKDYEIQPMQIFGFQGKVSSFTEAIHSEQKEKEEKQKKNFFLKKKKTLMDSFGPSLSRQKNKRKMSDQQEEKVSHLFDQPPQEQPKQQKIDQRQSMEYCKKSLKPKEKLPIFDKKQTLLPCHVDNYGDGWKFIIANKMKTQYLQDHEYIYLTRSRDSQILTIDIEKKPYQDAYVRNSNQFEDDYLCSSLFEVEVVSEDEVFLKHVLTQRYYPLKPQNQKTKLKLIPLLIPNKKQFPPFRLKFQEESFNVDDDELHAYWISKVDKGEVSEILSLQNVGKKVMVQYLVKYLQENTRRRQKLLRQFQMIPYLITTIIPEGQLLQQCYQLLFFICKNNPTNKKKCLNFIQNILNQNKKELILDILTELLIEESQNFFLQKVILPKVVDEQVTHFAFKSEFSLSFMRIFRVFCGPDEQPCVRNQNLLFNLFFWGESIKKNRSLTESVLFVQDKVTVPPRFKFKMFQDEGEIYFLNDKKATKYEDLSPQVLSYIRQYFYLISDCMKNHNYGVIQKFTNEISLNLLLKLLVYDNLKGPCLSLIHNAYLKVQRNYKPQIFHKDYDKICEKGALISFNITEQSEKLLDFILNELEINKDYKSTTFRILLNVVKLTIENGYWKKYDELINLVLKFDDLFSEQENDKYHHNYEEKVEDYNFMKSKITVLSIYIQLIDLQINLWVSDMVSQIYVEGELDDKIRFTKTWQINKKIFKLCSTNNSQLMKKSLVLLYKMYNIKKLFQKGYQEAKIQIQSQMDLIDTFGVIINSKTQNLSTHNYFTLISCCINDLTFSQLNPQKIEKRFYSLESIFKYKNANEEFQNIAYKLGIHTTILLDIKRYSSLRKKQKEEEQQEIYWKLLLLYSMIRNNLRLRDIISQNRKFIIPILQVQYFNYYVTVDILEEIYRNNRKLIISDTEELAKICKQINKVLKFSKGEITLRHCKLISLLGTFIQTGNRKIMENYQIIMKNIFEKEIVQNIILIFNAKRISKEQEDSKDYYNIFQILIYDLLYSMGEFKLLQQIKKPSNATINSLILGIGNTNWSLKSKVFSCIDFQKQKKQMKQSKKVLHFLRLILHDLNTIIDYLKTFKKENKYPKEVKIYISNLMKILNTIEATFEYIEKHGKLEEEESEQSYLIIKIVERLHLIKNLCPLVVVKKIKQLAKYVKILEDKLSKIKMSVNFMSLLTLIELQDFTSHEVKEEKLPLIFFAEKRVSENREKEKAERDENNMEKDEKKRSKQHNFLKGNLEIGESLNEFLRCLNVVNTSDATVLSDNLKDFLMNFLNTSFLTKKQSKELVYLQNQLVDYDIPSVICSILEEPFKERYRLFCSTFSLGIKLLEGGNEKSQKKFLKSFKEDGKNWIFQNIHSIIKDCLKTIEFYYDDKEDPTIKSYEMMLEWQQVSNCKEERELSCQLLRNVFQFMQLLCQNDNHQMKEHIYNQLQKDGQIKYMSKNFVQIAQSTILNVFGTLKNTIKSFREYPDEEFMEEIKQNIFSLPIFILQFLIEVCQIPAEQNQVYLCRTDFFDFVRQLIDFKEQTDRKRDNKEMFTINGENMFFVYERKIVMLLRGLLEIDSMEICDLLRKKIKSSHFQFFIEESFIHGGLEDEEKLKQMLQNYQLNGYIENVVDILIIKRVLKIEDEKKQTSEKEELIKELNNRIQSIHVNFKDHELTVYFPFHPLFSFLSKKTRNFLVDRAVHLNSRKEKITDFLISRQIVYQDIENGKNSEHTWMNKMNMDRLFSFAIFLCYFIILMLVFFYSVSKSGAVLDIIERKIIFGLSFMEFLVTAIYTILWGLNTAPIVVKKMKTHELLQKGRFGQPFNIQEVFTQKSKLKLIKAIYLDEPESAPAIFLFVLSFYACFFEVRAYSFTLIFVFAKISLLESIFKAIRLTWKQLFFVCLLALAFSFIFGFLTLNNYIGPLHQNEEIDIDINKINQHCSTIPTCISSLYTQKIIGQNVNREGEEYNYGRFVSDLVYWGFFEVLLTNIIAAIIIDKFAEQRNAQEKIQNQRFSRCYICFADRANLQRRGEDFNTHITKVHNIWNYFFYMYTLERLKDRTQFTGIQYWINRQVQENRIDWLPIDDSLKEENAAQNIRILTEKVNFLLKKTTG